MIGGLGTFLAFVTVTVLHVAVAVAGIGWLTIGICVYIAYRHRLGLDLTTTTKVAIPRPATETEAEYESVLVAFDEHGFVPEVMATATRMAARRRRGIHVLVTIAVPASSPIDATLPEQEAAAASTIEEARVQGGRRVTGHWEKVRAGQTARRIVDEATEMHAGAIVMPMSRTGGGFSRTLETVLRERPCRVIIEAAPARAGIQKVGRGIAWCRWMCMATTLWTSRRAEPLSARVAAITAVEIVAAVGVATGAIAALQSTAPASGLGVIYLLSVLVIAIRRGQVAALVAAVLSMLHAELPVHHPAPSLDDRALAGRGRACRAADRGGRRRPARGRGPGARRRGREPRRVGGCARARGEAGGGGRVRDPRRRQRRRAAREHRQQDRPRHLGEPGQGRARAGADAAAGRDRVAAPRPRPDRVAVRHL